MTGTQQAQTIDPVPPPAIHGPRADANGDGVVNALDRQVVIAHFGTAVA